VRQIPVLTLAALLAAGQASAQIEVRRLGDKVDVRATAATVSEVLDRLARETGMKVTYDGPPPRGRISPTLTGVTPAQAVLSVLEGQGLNYVLRMDLAGTRVETLLLVASVGAAPPVTPPRAAPGPRPIEREPETPEPEEEAPSEAAPPPEERRPGFPLPGFPGPPSGPAMPLTLPTPPPPVAPSPAPSPQG
jgi:hypothetical protein